MNESVESSLPLKPQFHILGSQLPEISDGLKIILYEGERERGDPIQLTFITDNSYTVVVILLYDSLLVLLFQLHQGLTLRTPPGGTSGPCVPTP